MRCAPAIACEINEILSGFRRLEGAPGHNQGAFFIQKQKALRLHFFNAHNAIPGKKTLSMGSESANSVFFQAGLLLTAETRVETKQERAKSHDNGNEDGEGKPENYITVTPHPTVVMS